MDVLPIPECSDSLLALLTRITEAVERGAVHLQAIDRRLSLAENRADPDFLSIKQAAAVAGLSPTKIRREIKTARLVASDIGTPAHPHYRISRSDLLGWMEKNRGGNNTPPRPQQIKRKVKSRYFGEI